MGNIYEKSALEAVTTTEQTLVADGFITFETNSILTGCSITHVAGTNVIKLGKRGLYLIAVNIDLSPTVTGDIAIQLVNNGVAIPGALATITGTAGDTYNLTVNALVRVLPSCCVVDNTASIQVQITEAGTVTNANIVVIKEA